MREVGDEFKISSLDYLHEGSILLVSCKLSDCSRVRSGCITVGFQSCRVLDDLRLSFEGIELNFKHTVKLGIVQVHICVPVLFGYFDFSLQLSA